MKRYRIGELAQIAGVSRRTIDYYTTLGLLLPMRSESNYRYYTETALSRLKLIEQLKAQRFTLEEIKEKLTALDGTAHQGKDNSEGSVLDLSYLQEQVKVLERQLAELQPMVNRMEANQAALMTKQVVLQSMAVMQSLLQYLNEVTPLI